MNGEKADELTPRRIEELFSSDRNVQYEAVLYFQELTERPVSWAYEVWDVLIEKLRHKDNHQRAIAAQILCNLAKSDPQARMLKDFGALLAVTKDERFLTARHCLQNLWKVGQAGKPQQELLVKGLEKRFHECISEKNCTLIRYDIIVDLRQFYDAVGDGSVRAKALELIETEADLKYKKKYAGVWKV
jgi:hypothetical protein